MRKLTLVYLAVLAFSFGRNLSLAQVASPCPVLPATKLESFETNNSSLIIKGTTEVGSLSVSTGVVLVRYREITETVSGHKEQGIAMTMTEKGQIKDTLLIDYDEIASLLNAMDFLNKIEFSVTSLNTFDAAYTTKGGFRVTALGSRLTGKIQYAVRDARTNLTPITFSLQDMLRLRGLIDQARANLDSLRGA